MKIPRIEVILPVYNGMPFLVEAIESLKNQTFSDFVVLCIDNGSIDGSSEYLKSIEDNRFKYFRLNEANLVKALNYGLEIASSEYIARMDADDISHSERFEKQIEFLEENPSVDIVGTSGKYFGFDLRKTVEIHLPSYHFEIINSMKKSRHALIHGSIMFRRESIFGNYYDEKYHPCEDFELFSRISNNVVFANLQQFLYYIRVHKNSIISSQLWKSITIYKEVSYKYFSANTKRKSLNAFDKLDICSLQIYRKGLINYLHNKSQLGIIQLLISALTNPKRAVKYLFRIFNKIQIKKM